MGAIGGGAAGYYGGNKLGGHGIIGALTGAFFGHKAEDKFKESRKDHNDGYGGGSSSGGWGR
jgi:outer membrane lipoprotein SlyB